MTTYLKGMCYSAFPTGYDPSTANSTCIFFGSDISSHNLKPLWGNGFSPVSGPDKDKIFMGRDDILTMRQMGVNLIRLYDWDSRNYHTNFLDYCHSNNIKVLVPVSNYNLGAYGTPPPMDESIRNLIKSFGNREGNNYHPAIYGIIIGSELDLPSEMPKGYLAKYTKKWAELENKYYPKYSKLPIGHPVSFATHNGKYPCFEFWDNLLAELKDVTISDLDKRLILCPHTYNEASYLFDDAEGSHRGWVDITYDKYNLPILFCEIGCSRLERSDNVQVVAEQLERSTIYQKQNKGKLLGTCFFQFCDKVWMPGTTEGSFGAHHNSIVLHYIVSYGSKDFSHTDGNNCNDQILNVNVLDINPVFNAIRLIYTC
jgi:hypothetical protein